MPYPPRSSRIEYERSRYRHPATSSRATTTAYAATHIPTRITPLIHMIAATLIMVTILS